MGRARLVTMGTAQPEAQGTAQATASATSLPLGPQEAASEATPTPPPIMSSLPAVVVVVVEFLFAFLVAMEFTLTVFVDVVRSDRFVTSEASLPMSSSATALPPDPLRMELVKPLQVDETDVCVDELAGVALPAADAEDGPWVGLCGALGATVEGTRLS